MPMSFPDIESLKQRAKVREFRQPEEGESEESFREALASHVGEVDIIESMEIRNKVGWDQWDDQPNVLGALLHFGNREIEENK